MITHSGLLSWLVVLNLVLVAGTGLAQSHKISLGTLKGPLNALVPMAIDEGFFAREGLAVTEKRYQVSNVLLNDLLAGKIDLAVIADTVLALKAFDRQDFQVLTELGSSDNFVKILARKDRDIQNPEDLRGKKIGLPRGTSFDFFLYLYLLRKGIPAKEVKIINMNPEEMLKGITAGKIDAFVERPNYITRGQKTLGDQAVVFNSPGLYRIVVTLTARKDYIGENPSVILKVLKALRKTEDKVLRNPDLLLSIMAARLQMEKEILRAETEGFKYELSLSQSFLLGLEAQARWAVRNRMTEKQDIPNFLEVFYLKGLKGIKPEAVSIIH